MVYEKPASLYAVTAAAAFVTSSLTASAWINNDQHDTPPKIRRATHFHGWSVQMDSNLNKCEKTMSPLSLRTCRHMEIDRSGASRHLFSRPFNAPSSSTTTLCESIQTELEIHPDVEETTVVLPPFDRHNSTVSYQRMQLPDRARLATHAIFGALLHDNLIERYELYRHIVVRHSSQESRRLTENANGAVQNTPVPSHETLHETGRDIVTAVVRVGHGLDGYQGVVHGGILALIMDDVLGFGCAAATAIVSDSSLAAEPVAAVTANLNVNYTAPVPSGATFLVTATLIQPCQPPPHPRKLHWLVRVTSVDQSVTYCRASSLYIIPRVSET